MRQDGDDRLRLDYDQTHVRLANNEVGESATAPSTKAAWIEVRTAYGAADHE